MRWIDITLVVAMLAVPVLAVSQDLDSSRLDVSLGDLHQSTTDEMGPDAFLKETDMPDDGHGGYCGDGSVGRYEQCDGGVPEGLDCADQGYDWGELGCTADCMFDYSACGPGSCGNLLLEDGESCDERAYECPYGETCEVCLACERETVRGPHCGDNELQHDVEECEDATFAPVPCAEFGFGPGTVVCTVCRVDVADCQGTYCGDGWVSGDEECDIATSPTTCSYNTECEICTEDCRRAFSEGGFCGDGTIQEGHERCDDGEDNIFEEDPCPYGEVCQGCDLLTCQPISLFGGECGDGVVQALHEACDRGGANIDAADPPTCANERGCTYCTMTCDELWVESEETEVEPADDVGPDASLEADADDPAHPGRELAPRDGCGCASSSSRSQLGWLSLLLGLIAVRRRRGALAPHSHVASVCRSSPRQRRCLQSLATAQRDGAALKSKHPSC